MRDYNSCRIEKSYGTAKTSYRASIDTGGFLMVKVCHDNKQTRLLIESKSMNPSALLSHYNRFSKSKIRAEYYLSEVMKDYWDYFKNNKVKIYSNRRARNSGTRRVK